MRGVITVLKLFSRNVVCPILEFFGPDRGLNDKLYNLKKLLKGKFKLIYENICDSREK